MTYKMKLSPETVAVLSNFSGIDRSILIKAGNQLRTISKTKSIIGVATIAESFDRDFAIADLPKFLASLSLFNSPELELGDKQLVIREGQKKLNYVYDDVRTVLSVEDTTVTKLSAVTEDANLQFDWKNADFQEVKKALAVLKLPEYVIEGNGTKVILKAQDTSNPTGNSYEAELGDTSATFRAVFRAENVRFLPLDYKVKYATRGLAKFESEKVTYIATTEAKK